MLVGKIRPASYNPRKITDKKLLMLGSSMEEFGDLSGIVVNRRTGNLVGGHQRIKCIPPHEEIKKTELKTKTKTGTVAEGYIVVDGEKWNYREVDWDEIKEKAANIAANQHGGEFDDDDLAEILRELDVADYTLNTGFSDEEIESLLAGVGDNNIEMDEIGFKDSAAEKKSLSITYMADDEAQIKAELYNLKKKYTGFNFYV